MKDDVYILGIAAYYHDAAAAIIKNGEIIAAAQEERFSRVKHDPRFPKNAINYCLEEAFIEPSEISAVVFYDNPVLTYDRIIHNSLLMGESSFETFSNATNSILGIKLWVEDHVLKTIGTLGKYGKIIFAGHHISHAASAFYPSSFNEAAVLTIDGVGEWSTTTISHGFENKISVLKEINYPHSLGLLYSAFTYYCGFKVNSGEYKLMGLAPYGEPVYAKQIYDNLIDIKADGSFRLNLDYFGFLNSHKTTNENFNRLFDGKEREPESRITRKEMNMAASIQAVTEDVVKKLAKHALDITGSSNLCLAGGVALNCVANGKILQDKITSNIWIQPASGDAGGALGACYVGHHLVLNEKRTVQPGLFDAQKGSYLGPKFSNNEIQAFLERKNYPYTRFDTTAEYFNELAKELADGKIIGFFNGRMEYGPRSLGARSIIGDARNKSMQSKMNLKIKYRESFRPFAPAVLEEDKSAFFDLDVQSPYMLLVAPVKESIRNERTLQQAAGSDDMIEIINEERSSLPAITHVDYSARVQTVTEETNSRFYNLLKAFKALTDVSVLVNTSFNVRGEPIVCSPKDAYTCFMRTDIDILVLEDFVLYKEKQPAFEDNKNWRNEYQPD